MSREISKPTDFAVAYTWQAGSMPPPYHYEYMIHIGPHASGEIVVYPDYPSEDTPRWSESFTVAVQLINELYAMIVKNDLLCKEWPEERNEPIGGEQEWLEITAGGKTAKIPGRASRDREVTEVYQFVRGLIPGAIWAGLMSRREEYERKYEDRSG